MGTLNRENLCPVCGFDLGFRAWHRGSGSQEICPSCGIQFGYSDAAGGDPVKRKELHIKWRKAWTAKGCKWSDNNEEGIHPPSGWDPREQLKRIGQSDEANGCQRE